MTLVIDKVTHDDEYVFPADFVPPFLTPREELPSEPVDLPTDPVSPPQDIALAAAPLGELIRTAAPTKKKRTLWGVIRACWFLIFTAAGEAVQYLLDNLVGIGLPPRTGAVVGAALYGAKRAIWPNTTL